MTYPGKDRGRLEHQTRLGCMHHHGTAQHSNGAAVHHIALPSPAVLRHRLAQPRRTQRNGIALLGTAMQRDGNVLPRCRLHDQRHLGRNRHGAGLLQARTRPRRWYCHRRRGTIQGTNVGRPAKPLVGAKERTVHELLCLAAGRNRLP